VTQVTELNKILLSTYILFIFILKSPISPLTHHFISISLECGWKIL